MAKIGILNCSNATQDLGCSSTSCLSDFRKRKGAFAQYPENEKLILSGIINCPGCPTLAGSDKLLQRIRALTEFGVDIIHFSYCVKALCPFKEKYKADIESAFQNVRVIVGTHEEHLSPGEFLGKVRSLFCQPRRTMVDVILRKDDKC